MSFRLPASASTLLVAAGVCTLAACTVEINKQPEPRVAHNAHPANNGNNAPHSSAPPPAPVLRTVHTNPPAKSLAHAAPVAAVDKVNVQAIANLKARSGRTCGAKQVAPNNWVHIDCSQYKSVAVAKPHMSTLKLQAVAAKSKTFATRNPSMAGTRLMKSVGAPADQFPDTVDHRTDGGEGPVKDQGEVGDCTAFSLSSVMDNQLRRANQTQTISPSHLWAHYGQPDMQQAGDGNINKGIITFDVWPYSGKEACEFETDGDPESEAECQQAYGADIGVWQKDTSATNHLTSADKAGQVKISEIDALTVPVTDITEMQSVLSSGSDIWIGIRMNGDAWSNASQKNSTIPDWSSIDGGHAVAIAGYRKQPDGTHQFLIHNSWAASWGDQGYGWISEAMVKKYLQYAYKIKLGGSGTQPAVLTDDDCSSIQLIDSITGLCAAICGDGSRPSNGLCTGN